MAAINAPANEIERSDLHALVEHEARAANQAAASLTDQKVQDALMTAALALRERSSSILEANRIDCEAAAQTADEGTLDRLRLDETRIASIAEQLEATAQMPPLDREARSWSLPNGLRVTERLVPIGTVGANFEARPNVAVDIAAQLLKSLNTAVLRTGGAALRTVTVIVDEMLRPALEENGILGGAVGLVRSPDREGARILVSLPRRIPVVILRGSGEMTATLTKLAAAHGVRTLAHAHGGGVLYVHGAASRERTVAIIEASLDRLGVCNRLNLLLVDRRAIAFLPEIVEVLTARGIEVRGTPEACECSWSVRPLDQPLGHEWANDPTHVATVTLAVVETLEEAVRIANEETSALAAGIVTEDAAPAEQFLDGYRGTAAFWHASTRFTDGYVLTGIPETGVNVDWAPGPRGPVTYRDLWLRQYRVVGDGTQRR